MRVFFASVVGLLLELALIRWVSCEVRIFAYFKNLVLVACFLGFGLGLLLHARPVRMVRAVLCMIALLAVVRIPAAVLAEWGPRQISRVMAALPGFMVFHIPSGQASAWGLRDAVQLLVALGWTLAIVAVVVYSLVPFGQLVGAGIESLRRPLAAYSVNVAGSLGGILIFTGLSALYTPPTVWFTFAVAAAVWLVARVHRGALLAAAVITLALLLPESGPQQQVVWTSYQKLVLTNERVINVNNVGFQAMKLMPQLDAATRPDRYTAPYLVKPAVRRVLIVGAGSGNDVAMALNAGAQEVTAVEIDRVITAWGRLYHPQRPYQDPRVHLVIDDARHFLKTTAAHFDLVVFSHLDSHAVLSGYTNVRLDDYIYTVEAFREVRARLAPGGLLYVSFWAEQPFIGPRLGRNLKEAFGHDPVALEEPPPVAGASFRPVAFFTGEAGVMTALQAASGVLRPGFEPAHFDLAGVAPSTDAWPFLPLASHHVPLAIALVSLFTLALAMALVWRLRPRGTPFDGAVFWLGAAFMLLEVHNVSRLALVFGTTWTVNAWVIGTILAMILLANAACAALARRGLALRRGAAVGLFVSLGLTFVVPVDVLAAGPMALGGLTAVLFLTTPIFFAGLVFADTYARSPAPSFALGWNALGAVVGGMTESASYLVGIPALVIIAAAFYAMALLWPRPR